MYSIVAKSVFDASRTAASDSDAKSCEKMDTRAALECVMLAAAA
jgi:hypothetical protein